MVILLFSGVLVCGVRVRSSPSVVSVVQSCCCRIDEFFVWARFIPSGRSLYFVLCRYS